MICNFIHTQFVQHPVQINGGKHAVGKVVVKNTEMNKTSHVLFEYVIFFILITKQSPVFFWWTKTSVFVLVDQTGESA